MENLTMDIKNSTFKRNHAKYGGVIYISLNNQNYNNYKRSLMFRDNYFISNVAQYFGGAIYFDKSIEYVDVMDDIKFNNNSATIGGAIYTDYLSNHESLSNKGINNNNKIFFINNRSKAYGNDYGSFPSTIILENDEELMNGITIFSGNTISLSFILKDNYNQTIRDNSNYHSNLILRVELIWDNELNNMNDTSVYTSYKKKYLLKNNVGYFSNGHCKFNELNIVAIPGYYKINFLIENNMYNTKFKVNEIPLKVTNCTDNKITMINDYNIIYCENPICNDDCDVKHSICMPSKDALFINSSKYNKCVCFPGYKGKKCNEMDYEPYWKIVTDYKIIVYIVIAIEFSIIIITFILRNHVLIYYHGSIKLILIQIGFILITISLTVIDYKNIYLCFLNVLLKHCGILCILTVFIYFIYSAYYLGVLNKETEIKEIREQLFYEKKISNKNLRNNTTKMKPKKVKSKLLYKIKVSDKSKLAINSFEPEDIIKEKSINYSNSSINIFQDIFFDIVKKILAINIKIFIGFLLLIALFILGLIIILIKKPTDKYYLDSNDLFMYSNPYSEANLYMNLFEFLCVILTFVKSSFIWKYENIFLINFKIYYSFIIILTIGILPNIISSFVLYSNPKQYLFNLIINSICYVSLYFILILNLLYNIIIKKQKNITPSDFFVTTQQDFCYFHRSYLCECNKVESDESIAEHVLEILNIYIHSSIIIEKNKYSLIKLVNPDQKSVLMQAVFQ
jgi:predicted outer membrane repeat protein